MEMINGNTHLASTICVQDRISHNKQAAYEHNRLGHSRDGLPNANVMRINIYRVKNDDPLMCLKWQTLSWELKTQYVFAMCEMVI